MWTMIKNRERETGYHIRSGLFISGKYQTYAFCMRKVLLFHIYPVNTWREVTIKLLTGVPHEDIFVHVSLPEGMDREVVQSFLASFKGVKFVFYSGNSMHPEVDGMEMFRNTVDLSAYSILTYMHSKGVTKPESQNIRDWTELMRYFVIDRMEQCIRKFKKGYLIYGVNKITQSDFEADFFYAGNFVSVNLTNEMVAKIRSTPIDKDYHGLEGFWGKLCSSRQAFNAFHSWIDHYSNQFPESYYKSSEGRLRYSIVSLLYNRYYLLRDSFTKFVMMSKSNIRRALNLYRVTTPRELSLIFFNYLWRRRAEVKNPLLHRLLIFAVACSDKNITLSSHSSQMLQASWQENGKEVRMLLRKYTRDLLVFSEFFLEKEGYLSFVKKYSQNDMVQFVIDAGANIGCAAVFLHVYFPHARIVCIEPENSNYNLLVKNVDINAASKKITCLNNAVWNLITNLKLMQRDHSSDAFHVMQKEISDEVISTIPTITIPSVLNSFNSTRLDFLKMDIEGAEKALFEDDRHLEEFLPLTSSLTLEIHTEFISISEIKDRLLKYNFNVQVLPHSGESAFVIANK